MRSALPARSPSSNAARVTFVARGRPARVDAPRRASLASSVTGFTLLELAVVLAIAGVMVAIFVPMLERYIARSRVVNATVEIVEMSKAIRDFEKKNGYLPASLGAVDAKYTDKTDPWGYKYEYFNLRTSNGNGQARKDKKLAPLNSDFDLYSVGSDGLTASSLGNNRSRDDVVRARDGGFIGLAEEFDP